MQPTCRTRHTRPCPDCTLGHARRSRTVDVVATIRHAEASRRARLLATKPCRTRLFAEHTGTRTLTEPGAKAPRTTTTAARVRLLVRLAIAVVVLAVAELGLTRASTHTLEGPAHTLEQAGFTQDSLAARALRGDVLVDATVAVVVEVVNILAIPAPAVLTQARFPSTQLTVPGPQSVSQAAPPPGLFSSVCPSQSLSSRSHSSVVGFNAPRHSPEVLFTQAVVPGRQLPTRGEPHSCTKPSTTPSQSLLRLSQSSGVGSAPEQVPQEPAAQVCCPSSHSPTSDPHVRVRSSSVMPSQSLSTLSQISG